MKNFTEVLNGRPGGNARNSVDQSYHYLLSMEFDQSICFSREVPIAEGIPHESQLQVALVWGFLMHPRNIPRTCSFQRESIAPVMIER